MLKNLKPQDPINFRIAKSGCWKGVAKSINLEKIFKPNGKLPGRQIGNNSKIRTVTRDQANKIMNNLIKSGAKKVDNPKYPGTWYKMPNGKAFGVRQSNYQATLKHDTPNTIDLENLELQGIIKLKYK